MNTTGIPAQNGFDAFRWIAALTIVVSHYCVLTQTKVLIVPPTNEAVQLFFILSGALTYRSFVAHPDTLSFFKRRARRILPAYWGTIIICLLIGLLFTKMPLREFVVHPQTWCYLAWNTIMLGHMNPDLPATFVDHVPPAMDGALWTMKYEVVFYLLLPLLILLITGRKKLRALLIIYIFLTLTQIALSIIDWNVQSETTALLASRGVAQATCFLAGIIVSEAFPMLVAKRKWLLPLTLALCLTATIAWPVYIVWPLLFATAIILLGTLSPKLGICRRLPPLTYELFLVHFPIIQASVEAGLPQHLGTWPAFAACLGLSLAMAYLLHRSVKPLTNPR